MKMIKGHKYQWILDGIMHTGVYTGDQDTYKGWAGNYIMINEEGVLWSINPQWITTEVKQESE